MSKTLKLFVVAVLLSMGMCISFVQPSHSATVVHLDATGPLASGVTAFQFDIVATETANNDDFEPTLPAGWVDGSFGTIDKVVAYFAGGTADSLLTRDIGSFFSTTAETVQLDLDSFILFKDTTNQYVRGVDFTVVPVGDDYNIQGVPIPGSILLLGSGLVGLIGLARRKRS